MKTVVPDFHTLPIGTYVVFHIDSAYQNKTYIFGLVVRGIRKTCRFQEVDTVSLQTAVSEINPQWNKLISGHIYNIVIGRHKYNKGIQYLDGYNEFPILKSMWYVPIFDGIYDKNISYIKRHNFN
jgi:hypothetical protein